ncbi:MAG: hypothetical protein ACOC2F_01340 [Bacteroidota bacterium]
MVKVLVLSSGNSVRSQMMEGWLKYYGGNDIQVHSAGVYENRGLNALANHVMSVDAVIDISGHSSDKVEKYKNEKYDWLILLHDIPEEAYKEIQASQTVAFYLEDPLNSGKEGDELVRHFVEIRNNIDDFSFTFIHDNVRNLIPTL